METKIKILIEKIENSDFTDQEKQLLIKKITKSDYVGFATTLITILKVSKEVLKFFDIDLFD
jgi:hypothetical protein